MDMREWSRGAAPTVSAVDLMEMHARDSNRPPFSAHRNYRRRLLIVDG